MSTGGPFGRERDRDPDEGAPAKAHTRKPDGRRASQRRGQPPPKQPMTTWVFGVFCVLVLGWIFVNAIQTEGPGSRGVPDGEEMPPFAVPLATSSVKEETDANLDIRRACGVRRPDVINSCELAERGPVVLAFFVTRSTDCQDQIDVLDRLRSRHPQVQFAAVAIRGDRDDVRGQIRKRRWRIPVGYDHDGALANAFAVAVCPTITFVRRGGEVVHTSFKHLDDAAISEQIARLGR